MKRLFHIWSPMTGPCISGLLFAFNQEPRHILYPLPFTIGFSNLLNSIHLNNGILPSWHSIEWQISSDKDQFYDTIFFDRSNFCHISTDRSNLLLPIKGFWLLFNKSGSHNWHRDNFFSVLTNMEGSINPRKRHKDHVVQMHSNKETIWHRRATLRSRYAKRICRRLRYHTEVDKLVV